ncbi:hypothetical protein B0T09DRAFT_21107 [Sordaria sp. MPI-SDFR-AT-0083]|nr:hypothetical protein B0T09DRAFT_21107 [Sordaria sp. MPI-SDFR-AT-0083]
MTKVGLERTWFSLSLTVTHLFVICSRSTLFLSSDDGGTRWCRSDFGSSTHLCCRLPLLISRTISPTKLVNGLYHPLHSHHIFSSSSFHPRKCAYDAAIPRLEVGERKRLKGQHGNSQQPAHVESSLPADIDQQ